MLNCLICFFAMLGFAAVDVRNRVNPFSVTWHSISSMREEEPGVAVLPS